MAFSCVCWTVTSSSLQASGGNKSHHTTSSSATNNPTALAKSITSVYTSGFQSNTILPRYHSAIIDQISSIEYRGLSPGYTPTRQTEQTDHITTSRTTQRHQSKKTDKKKTMPWSFSTSASAVFVGSATATSSTSTTSAGSNSNPRRTNTGTMTSTSATSAGNMSGWAYKRESYANAHGSGIRTTKQKLGEAPVTEVYMYDAQGRPLLVQGNAASSSSSTGTRRDASSRGMNINAVEEQRRIEDVTTDGD